MTLTCRLPARPVPPGGSPRGRHEANRPPGEPSSLPGSPRRWAVQASGHRAAGWTTVGRQGAPGSAGGSGSNPPPDTVRLRVVAYCCVAVHTRFFGGTCRWRAGDGLLVSCGLRWRRRGLLLGAWSRSTAGCGLPLPGFCSGSRWMCCVVPRRCCVLTLVTSLRRGACLWLRCGHCARCGWIRSSIGCAGCGRRFPGRMCWSRRDGWVRVSSVRWLRSEARLYVAVCTGSGGSRGRSGARAVGWGGARSLGRSTSSWPRS